MTDDSIEEKPKLYSKTTIVVFSFFLSTFFGGILYSQNLSETEKKKQITPVLIFCIIWNVLFFKVAHRFTSNFILTFLLPNIIGGLILSNAFWNSHFKNLSFRTRTIWGPLAVVIVLYGLLIGLNVFIK